MQSSHIAILVYLIIAIAICSWKPKILTTKDGKYRTFGVSADQCIVALPNLLCIIATLVFFIVLKIRG